MFRFLKGLVFVVCILLGITLITNVDKGGEAYAPDQIQVQEAPEESLESIVATLPDTRLLDAEKRIVGVPYGETEDTIFFSS